MTEQREVRVPFNDLLTLVLECQCGTEIAIDFAKDDVRKKTWADRTLSCPVCQKEFDSNLRRGFEYFIQWQDSIEASRQEIFFKIRNPTEPVRESKDKTQVK